MKMDLNINLSLNGMDMLFKEYQEKALRYIWGSEVGRISREVWVEVNKQMGLKPNGREKISRASIINFLNKMVDTGILSYTEQTGKGGYHRVYSTKLGERALLTLVRETVNAKLDILLG